MAIWLIQRGTIRRSLVGASVLSDAVRMDYMGSAEFEFGALPKSLREMESTQNVLKLVSFDQIVREDGCKLIGYGAFDEPRLVAYSVELVEVAQETRRCKEWTHLPEAMHPSQLPPHVRTARDRREYLDRLTSFWWDIEGHVMMSFDKDFMERLPQVLKCTWSAHAEQRRLLEL